MPWSVQRLDLLLPLCVSVQCDICPEDAVWLLLRLLVTVVLLEEPPLQQRQRNLERYATLYLASFPVRPVGGVSPLYNA